MIVDVVTAGEARALPGELLTELAGFYASDRAFQQLGGDFPDPARIRPEDVAVSLADDLAHPDAEVLLARSAGRLVAVAVVLAADPDQVSAPSGTDPVPEPVPDPDPWIALLMVHGRERRSGYGRELAGRVEDRFRAAGHRGVRLSVAEANTGAVAFWTALGYEETGSRPDRRGHRCRLLRKAW
ncbi:GNAT family N-acetyltransferase [Streptomyces sp. SID3212]|uniref:GNAT family N-acetyltransferase n=1 Tax=Streptomyces sp. SID3212 TaxID=2690259 RepID=UPI001368F8E7|nr:GNAT family N-acetyltransferase [Streptomyces sp. SID3212]MYV51103.1 GNAT family N-acetyltransferase [Streptomyces sp. SID3212]